MFALSKKITKITKPIKRRETFFLQMTLQSHNLHFLRILPPKVDYNILMRMAKIKNKFKKVKTPKGEDAKKLDQS